MWKGLQRFIHTVYTIGIQTKAVAGAAFDLHEYSNINIEFF